MATLQFVVPAEWDGCRLETFLRQLHGISSRMLTKVRHRPLGLRMNGRHIRTIDPVLAGALVEVDVTDEERVYTRCDAIVAVPYEDDDLIVFDKPAGMASHPGKQHDTDTLANIFAARTSTAGLVYRVLGRLDQDTSGLVVVAKHRHAAHRLPRLMDKCYLAVVEGMLPREGVVDAPIAECPGERKRVIAQTGRSAVTRYYTIWQGSAHSIALLRLQTGRTHQIRLHMSSLGYPLAGDLLYGGTDGLIGRQALHCVALHIDRPEQVLLTAPLPDDLRALLGALGAEALETTQDTIRLYQRKESWRP